MATTVTLANIGQKPIQNIDPTKKPGRGILVLKERILNIDSFPTVAASDSYQCIEIKGGETVIDAGIDVLKVATAANGSADLDFAKGDTFLDGLDTDDISLPTNTDRSTAGGEHITNVISAGTSNSDTIDVTFSAHSPAGGIFRVWALVHRMGPISKVGT
jgi:hypothetical protein